MVGNAEWRYLLMVYTSNIDVLVFNCIIDMHNLNNMGNTIDTSRTGFN